MTAAETQQVQRIAERIGRGDYSALKDGGERLVFKAAREVGTSPAQLIRLWATRATNESKKVRVVVEVDDDAEVYDGDTDDADDNESEYQDEGENENDECGDDPDLCPEDDEDDPPERARS